MGQAEDNDYGDRSAERAAEDASFDAWQGERQRTFDAVVRDNVDTEGVLRAIKRRAAQRVRQEMDSRVAVAAITGRPQEVETDPPGGEVAHPWQDNYLGFRTKLRTLARTSRAGFRDNPGIPLLLLVRPLAYRYARAECGVVGAALDVADSAARDALAAIRKRVGSWRQRGVPEPRDEAEDQPLLRMAYTIVRETVRDRIPDAGQDPAPPGPDGEGSGTTLSSWLGTLLRGLPNQQREVVVLRVVVGLSTAETATALSTSEPWVRSQQSAALTTLRREVAVRLDGPAG